MGSGQVGTYLLSGVMIMAFPKIRRNVREVDWRPLRVPDSCSLENLY